MRFGRPAMRARVTPERVALLCLAVVVLGILLSGPRLGRAGAPAAPAGTGSTGARATASPSSTLGPAQAALLVANTVSAHGQIAVLERSLESEIAAKRIDAHAVMDLLTQVELSTQSATTTAGRLAASSVARPLTLRLITAYDTIVTAIQVALAGPVGDVASLKSSTTRVIDACSALAPLTDQLRALGTQLQSPAPSRPAQGTASASVRP